MSPAASSTFLPSPARLRRELADRRGLAAAVDADDQQHERLRRREVDGRRRQRQDLGRAPAQERPDRVGIGQLAARQRAADLLEQLLAGAHADVGGQQHLLDLVDDRRVDLLLAREDLAQTRDEAAARARQAGREGGALADRARGRGTGSPARAGARPRVLASVRRPRAGAPPACARRGRPRAPVRAPRKNPRRRRPPRLLLPLRARARGPSAPASREGAGQGLRRRRSIIRWRAARARRTSSRPPQPRGHDATHDSEQLVELGGVYRRARRVHGGWDTIIKRRCASMAVPGRGIDSIVV